MLEKQLKILGAKTVTIRKAPLTATYKDETITFGEIPEYKVVVTDFVNSEEAATLEGFKAPALTTSAKIPGVYTLMPDANDTAKNPTDNYEFVNYVSGTLNILAAKMDSNISADSYSGTYDGGNHGITVNMPTNATVKYGTSSDSCVLDTLTYKNAGQYTVYYKVTKEGYEDFTGSQKVTIAKKELIATFKNEVVEFDVKPNLEIIYSGFVVESDIDTLDKKPTVMNNNTLPDIYELYPNGGTDNNYSFKYALGTLTITAKEMPENSYEVVPCGHSILESDKHYIIYDRIAHGITVIPAAGMTGTDVKYGDSAENCTMSNAISYINAGKYTVYYAVSRPGYISQSGSFQFTIKQRPLTATVVEGAVGDKVYDGNISTTLKAKGIVLNPNNKPVANKDQAGIVFGDNVTVSGTVTFVDKNAATNKAINVNEITLAGIDQLNYRLIADTLTDIATTAKITPKPINPEWKFGTNPEITHNRVYDGQPSNVYAVATVDSGLILGEFRKIKVTGGNQIAADDHIATATDITFDNGTVDPNYKISGTSTRTYKNTPALLTAKCPIQSMTYVQGMQTPTFKAEVEGFVGEETAISLGKSYIAPTVAVNREIDGEGEYSLIASGGSAPNYEFEYPASKLVITAGSLVATVGDYSGDYDGNPHTLDIKIETLGATTTYYTNNTYSTETTAEDGYSCTDAVDRKPVYYIISAQNHEPIKGEGYIQISPKKISVSLKATDTPTKVYDGTTTATDNVTLEIIGAIKGKEPIVTGKLAFDNKSVATNKAVTASDLTLADGNGKASNYKINDGAVSGILKEVAITAKPLEIIWSGNEADKLVYSGTAKNVTATIKSGIVKDDSCNPIVIGGNAINVGTSEYTATAGLDNPNYKIEPAANATKTYKITKKELTAVLNNEEINFNNPPELYISVMGFENGETTRTASGFVRPTVSTDPIPVKAGTHEIHLKGGSADNYTFKLVNTGKLTINPISMNEWIISNDYTGVYDGKAHEISLAFPANAMVKYYTDNSYTQPLESVPTRTNAGAIASYYKVEMPNYIPVEGNRTITISKKPIVAEVTGATDRTYDGTTGNTGASLVLKGVLTNDTVSAASDNIHFVNKNAGSVKAINVSDIKLGGISSDNYNLTNPNLENVPTNATITPKVVKLTWQGTESLIYNGQEKVVTATAGDVYNDDTCKVEVRGGAQTIPGSYTARAISLSNGNYKLPETTTEDFTIAKGKFNVKVTPYKKIFNNKVHPAVTLNSNDLMKDDKISYKILSSSVNNVENPEGKLPLLVVPMIAQKGSKIQIEVKIERLYHEAYVEIVNAHVWSAPKITLEAPEFNQNNPTTIKIKGFVDDEDALNGIEYVQSVLSVENGSPTDNEVYRWSGLPTYDKKFKYEETFNDLTPNTTYEILLRAATILDKDDVDGEQADMSSSVSIKFRTLPLSSTAIGEVMGTVRNTSGKKNISVTLRKSNIVIASCNGLESNDTFTFSNISDGEYNLVAVDDIYTTNQIVTVKKGVAVQKDIVIVLNNKQTEVLQRGLANAPTIAVDGMNELFEESKIKNHSKIKTALNNKGTVNLVLEISPTNEDDIIRLKKVADQQSNPVKIKGLDGVSVNMSLYAKIKLSSAAVLDEPDYYIRTVLDNPLYIAMQLPPELQNKNSYNLYRSHANGDAMMETAETTVEEFRRLKSRPTIPEKDSFYVSGEYVYIYSNKFSTFLLTFGRNSSVDDDDTDESKITQSTPILPSEPVTGGTSGSSSQYTSTSSDNGSADLSSSSVNTNTDKPAGNVTLDEKKEDPKDALKKKLDEVINGLPNWLTDKQRQSLLEELNNIYEEGLAAINSGTTETQIIDAFDQAMQKLSEMVLAIETDGNISSGWNQKAFVALSALLTLGTIALAIISFGKKRKIGEKSAVSIIATTVIALIALITFAFTSGTNGVILANLHTIIYAVLFGVSAIITFYKSNKTINS